MRHTLLATFFFMHAIEGCTEELKICPGTFDTVSRNPALQCEFDPCPDPEEVDKNKKEVVDSTSGGIGCTDEIKVCPDSSRIVSRNPALQCDFDPCLEMPKNCSDEDGERFKVCPSGELVARDPYNDCQFFACDDSSESEG